MGFSGEDNLNAALMSKLVLITTILDSKQQGQSHVSLAVLQIVLLSGWRHISEHFRKASYLPSGHTILEESIPGGLARLLVLCGE